MVAVTFISQWWSLADSNTSAVSKNLMPLLLREHKRRTTLLALSDRSIGKVGVTAHLAGRTEACPKLYLMQD
jgi:hypothetical protein